MFEAKVICDSTHMVGQRQWPRLTTLEVTFPRIVLAEFNTHRMFSRNSASSRAIPISKQIERVVEHPYIPVHLGRNQAGMQAGEELDEDARADAVRSWLTARNRAVEHAREMAKLGVHKQVVNRLLEPFLWHTAVVTATEWENFFNLRDHPAAAPEMQQIARLMKEAMAASTPVDGVGHMPYIRAEDIAEYDDDPEYWMKVSVGRCARVSYLTHDGTRDPQADFDLATRLIAAGHMSPTEHVAVAAPLANADRFYGNFRGWIQYRKGLPNESVFQGGAA